MRVIHTEEAPSAIGPYSQAVIAKGFVFASGQIPLSVESSALVGGTAAEQTEQVIKNIAAVLTAGGSDLSRVVKTTCFLQNMDDFAAFNEVYARHFTGRPARSCVAAAALPRGALVEIEAIAETAPPV